MARCRRCGRELRSSRINETLANPAPVVEAARAGSPCDGFTTPAQDLYGVTYEKIRLITCCEPSGCQKYDSRARLRFWPAFAHPRWLTCEQLYSAKL